MNMDISLPDKTILEVTFLKKNDFYTISLQNQDYLIVGGDEGIHTNLIGIAKNGTVYYITTDDGVLCYISPNIEIFVKELLLYDEYMNHKFSENLDESMLSDFANQFRKEILKFDNSAFDSGSTYWSEICEEMEYGF